MIENPTFILAGNGPYENRGCEAIVRGTVKILREYYENPRFICLSHFKSEEQFKKQRQEEYDKKITHLSSHKINKKTIVKNFWNPHIWKKTYMFFFNKNNFYKDVYKDLTPYLNNATAVLSVGGDNYSLDYGIPTKFTALDDIVLERQKPLIIWGASVGPFKSIPDYENYMSQHLQKITGIFARETSTVEYLENIDVNDNVYQVADPAFLMEPVIPDDPIHVEKGAIGLNLSPLMAKFVAGGDMDKWTSMAADIIAEVSRKTDRPLYLIPHVTNPDSSDHVFMQKALSQIPGKHCNIKLVPPFYNASETKWLISQMDLFAGARTHATIAALSSCVPTLSFAYSIKAKGINNDIFGHDDFCLDPKELTPTNVTERIESILELHSEIKDTLEKDILNIQKRALLAGKYIYKII